jgi:hypothetical protein
VKRSDQSSFSIAADSTSADRTLRRNSPKFFSSLHLSGSVFIVFALDGKVAVYGPILAL